MKEKKDLVTPVKNDTSQQRAILTVLENWRAVLHHHLFFNPLCKSRICATNDRTNVPFT